jgi:hypothetical protein
VNHSSAEDVVRERLRELADDLRLALPGGQVLFAFLLTLPFASRFAFTGTEKAVFYLAFITSVLAVIFLIAPSALHRVYHQLRDPGGLASLLRIAGVLAVIGSAFLAVSIGAAVFLITDTLYAPSAAAIVAAVVLGVTALLWFALPVMHRMRY